MKKPVSLSHWGAFEATVEKGRLVRATPCAGGGASAEMIGAIPELLYSDTRILCPHIRRSWLEKGHHAGGASRGKEEMVPVEWGTALDAIASEITRVRDTYGHKALFAGSYGWSSAGRFHHARTQTRRFYGAVGGFTDQVGNYSWGAAQVILEEVLGTADAVRGGATAWDSIVGNTDTFVAFGGLNPKNWKVTSGGAGHHHMPDHVQRAAKEGTHFVIISPFADDVPEGVEADWIAPYPGSDTAIMLGLAYEMVRRKRADLQFLARFTSGADRFIEYLHGTNDGVVKSLEWAARIADIPRTDLERLADRITEGRVMLTATWSLQRAENGEMTFWALIALAALLGQIGLPGGGFGFGYGSLNAVGHGATKGLIPTLPLLGNEKGTAIPVARFADMLEKPGQIIDFRGGQVELPEARLVHWAGGNPFHHAQDLFRLDRLWQRPETIIVNEHFWTATAQRADIVLPACTAFERCDIGGTSRDRHVFYMPCLVAPHGHSKTDYAIFSMLADRLGIRPAFTEGLDEEGWLKRLWATSQSKAASMGLEAPDFEALKAMNVWPIPKPKDPEVLLKDFRDNPEQSPLPTSSGRIELTCSNIESYKLPDMLPHPAWRKPSFWAEGAPAGTFALLSRQPENFLHSQLAQTELATDPEIVIHNDDAAELNLTEGDLVRISTDRGACLARLRCTTECRRGVAAMATGPWFNGRNGLDPAGNPNVLTSDVPTSTLSQSTAAQSCMVRLQGLAPARKDGQPQTQDQQA